MDKDNAPSVAVTGADGNGQASVAVSADPTTYGGAATGMPLRVGLPEDPPSYQGLYETPPPPLPPPLYYVGELPPAYQVATALPTYEEAEMAKGKGPSGGCEEVVLEDSDDEQRSAPRQQRTERTTAGTQGRRMRLPDQTPQGFLLTFPSFDDSLDTDVTDDALLGNDFVFFTAFLTSFLFNWIGFLLLMCFCHTIAARYGALSGFGLSLAKWTLIVKNSTDFATGENAWLWWIIAAFGMLVCMRAIVQYLHIKRNWRHLSTAARERLFFFY